ncbi:MAG: Fic family protein [Chloroflexi bacterium]|nr:Fic family protein [Chloroflexota bacterium]
MGRLEARRWEGDARGQTRRDRLPCDYEVYIPDPLLGRRFVLDGDVAADVADAEAALVRLNATAGALADTEALARLLLRAEAVASSRIEGLDVGGRRLLRAQAARELGEDPRDVTAVEVLGNIDAMRWAAEAVPRGGEITVEIMLEARRRLLAETPLAGHAGRARAVQNWIGGSSYNPCAAAFVPPPPEQVDEFLSDLAAFCNDESLPAVAQAAIAHAQFETIHPFVDGNGRTGRALTHLVLRRRGLASRVLAPISLILATWPDDYIAGLTATRHDGPPDSEDAQAGMNSWIALFAGACRRAAEDASRFEIQVRALQDSWRERLSPVRGGSSVDLLVDALPGAPLLTTNTASDLIGRSFQATSLAIDRFVSAGILRQMTVGRRNRAFEAPEIIEAFTALERRLASPEGDTLISEPIRRVPRTR